MLNKLSILLQKININLLSKFIIYLIIFGLFIINSQNIFFWDTVQLASKHAHWYYQDFTRILLPNEIDSGHIPTFGYILAFTWKIFGKSLFVSHIMMLPFVIGIVIQSKILISKFFAKKNSYTILLLFLSDASLLSQMSLVSPDVVLIFLFLLSLNSLFHNNQKLLTVAITFLFLISMRGMMVAFCIFVFDMISKYLYNKRINIFHLSKRILYYLPGLLIFIVYNSFHYYHLSWIGFHNNSPWVELFSRVDFYGFIKNIFIYIWRLIDFGRISYYIILFILFIIFKKKIFLLQHSKLLIIITIIFLLILPLNMLWANNLLGHRYLIPIYLMVALLTIYLTVNLLSPQKLKYAFIFIFITNITGNLWVYPRNISQGWDSTLAHLPYYSLRNKVIKYIDENNYDYNDINSYFPNAYKLCYTDLINDTITEFRYIENEKYSKYILYSNVFNLTNKELNVINNKYKLIKRWNNYTVYFELYERK